MLAASVDVLDRIPPLEWTHEVIQEALSGALIDGLGLKPRVAYTPLRVAVSGRRVSPPLFESMQILGKDDTLARLARLQGELDA